MYFYPQQKISLVLTSSAGVIWCLSMVFAITNSTVNNAASPAPPNDSETDAFHLP